MQKVQESINASNFLLVGNQTGRKTSKAETDVLGFADVLTEAEKTSNQSVERENGFAAEDKNAVPNKEVEKQQPNEAKDTVEQEHPVKEQSIEDQVNNEVVEPSEEEKAVILETMSTVLQMVLNQFQISMEELTDKLNAFGMKLNDLFGADGLKEFFLHMNMADVSDLLVNEDMSQELQSFMEGFNQLLQENGVTEDEITAFTENGNMEDVIKNIMSLSETLPKTGGTVFADDNIQNLSDESTEPEVIVTDLRHQEAASKQEGYESKKNTSENAPETKVDYKTDAKTEHFENPILQAVHEAVDHIEMIDSLKQSVRGADVIEQIVEQIRINMNQNTTSMELQLYPEHLGKIQINVVSKDGIMTARIVAETEAAKQAIEGGLTNLKESMEQQNLKVDAIEVLVSTTGFEKGNEEQSSFEEKKSSQNRNQRAELSEVSEDNAVTEAEIEKMKATGSSVSYTA